MAQMTGLLTYQGIPVWRHARILQWTTQIVSAFLAVVLVVWFFLNIGGAIQDRNIPYGFSFLDREYQTPIGHHFLPYESSDSFLYALGVAATNTVFVSIVGVILATALGIVIGVSRLSGNWIVSKLALVFVEFFRNVPLLVQLFFWFYIFLALPPERDGFVFFDRLYVNNAGVSLPWPVPSDVGTGLVWLALALVGVIAGVVVHRFLLKRETMTGRASYPVVFGAITTVGIGLVTWIALMVAGGESPFVISQPAQQGTFARVAGGFTAPAGLLALLIGLVMYTASFIAEIVRAGITSVGRGQTEAARAGAVEPVGPEARHVPAGAASHHPAAHQPVPEPDQEQQSGRGNRLLRPDERGEDDDADGARGVDLHSDYVVLSGDESRVLAGRQLIQPIRSNHRSIDDG